MDVAIECLVLVVPNKEAREEAPEDKQED